MVFVWIGLATVATIFRQIRQWQQGKCNKILRHLLNFCLISCVGWMKESPPLSVEAPTSITVLDLTTCTLLESSGAEFFSYIQHFSAVASVIRKPNWRFDRQRTPRDPSSSTIFIDCYNALAFLKMARYKRHNYCCGVVPHLWL